MRLQKLRKTWALVAWVGASALQVAQPLVAAPLAPSAELRADGSRFALTLPDGNVLHSKDLVGATLRMQDGRPLRIDAVQAVTDPRGQTLWQHTLSTPDEQGNWNNLCQPHADGSRTAMVVPGQVQADGTVVAHPKAFTLSCSSGAQGKCLRFGYQPWRTKSLPNGFNARDLYNACIRMVRADYGGNGHGYTKDGMSIDVYDQAGIQQPDRLAEHEFEAGWGPNGAVCVHHARVAQNTTLAQLTEKFPKLKNRVGPVCTEAFARRHGAVVFNRSAQHTHNTQYVASRIALTCAIGCEDGLQMASYKRECPCAD